MNGNPVTVPPTTVPWTWQNTSGGLNQNYQYGLNDGTAPVVAATNLTAGQGVSIVYQRGTVSGGYPFQTLNAANGDSTLITGTAEETGAYFPTLYTTSSAYPSGQPITISTLVNDSTGAPAPNISVTLTIPGANPAQLQATTDSTGTATFVYAGTNAGADTLQAQLL